MSARQRRPRADGAVSRAEEPAAVNVPIDAIHPWPDNPHKGDVPATMASIKRFGFGAPIVARRENGEVIKGHTRLEAARRLGLTVVPVRYMDLDADEAHKLAVADNQIPRLGEDDPDLLAKLTDAWRREGDTLSELGYGAEELKRLHDLANPTVEDDTAPEPDDDGPWDSTAGTTYALGDHVLVCGDSTRTEIVAGLLGDARPRLTLFDPPFDQDYLAWDLRGPDVVVAWHRSDVFYTLAASLVAAGYGTHSLVFSGGVRGQHNHTLPCCMHENVTVFRRKWWTDKLEAIDRAVLEKAGARCAKDGRHISWQEHSGGVLTGYGGMSWGKPVLQYEIALAYVPGGSIVYDPCAGSGSSLIASQKHGRLWRGVESAPKWADLIRRRWGRWAAANGVAPGKGALR